MSIKEDETKIPVSILRKLPNGGTFLRLEEVENMDREKVMAIKWMWNDPMYGGLQKAFFDLRDGGYICHDIMEENAA